MAIGDLLFALAGQQDPRQRLYQALGQGAYSPAVAMPFGGGQAVKGQVQPVGVPGNNQPPASANPAAGALNFIPAAQPDQGQQQGQQQPGQQQGPLGSPGQPSPQAYQSPSDLIQLYDSMLRRQQANAQITSGMGLIASAFSRNPQDRQNILNATTEMARSQGSGAGMPSLGDIMNLQQAVWQRQMMMQQMQHIPAIAKELGISEEMATNLFMSGKLGDVTQQIAESKYEQGTPKYNADVNKTVAETALANAGVTKTQAETEEAKARTGAIPADVALKQAQTQEALANVPKSVAETNRTIMETENPTEQIKQYNFVKKQWEQQNPGQTFPMSPVQWFTYGPGSPDASARDYGRYLVGGGIYSPSPIGAPVQPAPTGVSPAPATGTPAQQTVPPPVPGLPPVPALPPGLTPDQYSAAREAQKGAVTKATESLTVNRSAAQASLPELQAQYDKAQELGQSILDRKDKLGNIVGYTQQHLPLAVAANLPGSNATTAELSNLNSDLDQFAEMGYLQGAHKAREAIGGRVAVVEANAAADAQTQLHNRGQDVEHYATQVQKGMDENGRAMATQYILAGMPVPAKLKQYVSSISSSVIGGPPSARDMPTPMTAVDKAQAQTLIKQYGRDYVIRHLKENGYDASGL